MGKSFKENFNFITNILLIFILVFGGIVFADTNGVWHRAEDIQGGIFGSDETLPSDFFIFNNTIKFLKISQFYDNVEINSNLSMNGNLNITGNLYLNSTKNCNGKLNTDSSGKIICNTTTDSVGLKNVKCTSGEVMVGFKADGSILCELNSGAPVNQDCLGTWNYNANSCSASCGPGNYDSQWTMTQPKLGTGAACPSPTFIDNGGNACNLGACAIPCSAYWSDTTSCSATCGASGVFQEVYTINSGAASCPFTNGATRWGSTACNRVTCTPTMAIGNNDYGQLTYNTGTEYTPRKIYGEYTFVKVSAGNTHSCGLTSDGTAYCWGDNRYGQLGDGSSADNHWVTAVSGGHKFSSIAAASMATCAIRTDGQAMCWGNNGWGQLGDTTISDRWIPTLVSGGNSFTKISAGAAHFCALKSDGQAMCWGMGIDGEIGDGFILSRSVPTAVSGGNSFTSISTAQYSTCGIRTDGQAMCWGYNGYGALGDNTLTNRKVPTLVVSGTTRFTSIAGYYENNCAITTSGNVMCWGINIGGPGGMFPTGTYAKVPTLKASGYTFTSISMGGDFYGLTSSGDAYSFLWATPTIVPGGYKYSSVDSGANFALFIKNP